MNKMMNYRVLTGSALKLIAVTTMAIDHAAAFLLCEMDSFVEPFFIYHHHELSWYVIMRGIGRMAFPIFAFLIVEGFVHTRNRRRYGWSLFACALISEIPWALTHQGFHLMSHNVMFTLLWGYLALCAIERWREDYCQLGLTLIGMLAIAFLFHADYNGPGFAFIVMLYALRKHLLLQTLVGCCMLPMKWVAGLAFIPISMYNGHRGCIHGVMAKYLFYVFYPAHLFVLWLLHRWLC